MNKPPKPPLPPKSDPRNVGLRAHEIHRQGTTLEELRVRQSDHEFKAQENINAMMRRDEDLVGLLAELGDAQIVVARELGIEHRLPPALRNRSSSPPPLNAGPHRTPAPRPPVLPDIQRESRLSRKGAWITLAVVLAELALEFLRHIGGF